MSQIAGSQFSAAVRVQGAAARQTLSQVYLASGPTYGEEVARRWIWEVADLMLEVHGPTVVQDVLRDVGASIQLDHPPLIAEPEEDATEEPDPHLQVVEGLTTVTDQVRQNVATMAQVLGLLVTAVNRLDEMPADWSGRVWWVVDRVAWLPLGIAIGAIAAAAVR